MAQQQHCLNMQSVFGFNKDLPGGVHSLFDEQREAIVYPASHTLVYFDCSLYKQTFLQGHASFISAVAVSNDKKWIFSGDAGGYQSLIIVWNAETKLPVRTYQLDKSVLRIDLSDDGALIAVLTDAEPMQDLHIFEWSSPSEYAAVSATVDPTFGFQRDLRFNPADFRYLVTNSPFRTVFWEWEETIINNRTVQQLAYHAPELTANEFKTMPSAFTVSCFLPKTTAALTATVSGEVVLYDEQNSKDKKAKHAIKLLTLHTSSHQSKYLAPSQEISAKSDLIMLEQPTTDYLIPGPNYFKLCKSADYNRDLLVYQYYQYLTQAQSASAQMTSTATQSFTQAITYIHAKHDGFIITGGLDGAVRMFDFRLRLLSWYENLEAGPITSISIVMPLSSQLDNQLLSQAAVQLLPGTTPREVENKQEQLKYQFGSVILRDFLVGTQRGSVILVPAAVFELVEPEKRRGQVLYYGLPGNVTATCAPRAAQDIINTKNTNAQNPRPLQYIATDRGDLVLYDYTTNTIANSVNLSGDITATGGGSKLRGTLAQRHLEGFEQASFLVPTHPCRKIKTMRYAFVTCLEMGSGDSADKPILLCGTSLGTCLLMDPVTLYLLSSFTHLSQMRTIKAPPYFRNEGREIVLQYPAALKFVKMSQGDVVAAVDELSYLTLLTKTQTNKTYMDPITGKVLGDEETTQKQYTFNNTVNNSTLQSQLPLQVEILKSPPKFVTEFEDDQSLEEKRTVTQVRIHPAALLARANQRRRDAASTAGQWQNLGKTLVSHAATVSCDFLPFKLYDEIRNEVRKDYRREPLVLVARDRYITIIDIEYTLAQVEPDRIVIDRRFRSDQEAIPTAVCFLPRPPQFLDDAYYLQTELEAEGGKYLKQEVNRALLSLQTTKQGLLNATLRPELYPLDQRDLLVIANNQYKFQVRQLSRFNQSVEISNRTILSPQQIYYLNQQTAYFSAGYPTQYPMMQQNVNAANGIAPYIPGGVFGLNSRLAGPLPLRRTVLGPTFAGYITQLVPVSYETAAADEHSMQVQGERHPYRTDYEVLNQAGSVRHKCQYLVFSTPYKVIGMIRTPLDGAPHRYVGLVASAGELLGVDVAFIKSRSADVGNTFVMSAGRYDCCTFLFGVDYPMLDLMIDASVIQYSAQTSPFDPFLNQLRDGALGDFYTLVYEYFSYAYIHIAEQKGLSPSEEARAPVSMLPDILRALGIYLNNEQIANATAELVEEDLRGRRLKNYLMIIKRAFNEKRLPCPFDQRENLSMICDLNPKCDIKPFYSLEIEDVNSLQPKWEEDGEFNEYFEQSLFEVVGSQEITMGLQDLVRIIVNYRQLAKITAINIKRAFEQIGAKDRVSFQENMALFGEKIESGELLDLLYLCQQEGYVILPEAINAEEFITRYLKLDIDEGADEDNYDDQQEEEDYYDNTQNEYDGVGTQQSLGGENDIQLNDADLIHAEESENE